MNCRTYDFFPLHLIIIMINRLCRYKLQLLFCPSFSSKKVNFQHFDQFPLEHYDVGQRLDRYLKSTAIGWISAQKFLRQRDIAVLKADGSLANENNYRICEGDKLIVRKGKMIFQQLLGKKNSQYLKLNEEEVNQKLKQMIIFDNPNITVLNKLGGYSVQGGSDPNSNLFSLMASRYKKDMIYISHRLDKPTTGLVMISKNLATAQILGQTLQSRSGLSKYYLALTEGREITQKFGTLSNQLQWTSKHKAKTTDYLTQDQNSQLAVTNYQVLKEKQLSDILWKNLIGLKLVTGRKHQIRCQLSQNLVNPILNDLLYSGRKIPEEPKSIFLHSFALKITSKALVQQVFKLKEPFAPIQNEKGTLKLVGDQIHIIANLSNIWNPYKQTLTNENLPEFMQQIDSEKNYPSPPKVMRLK